MKRVCWLVLATVVLSCGAADGDAASTAAGATEATTSEASTTSPQVAPVLQPTEPDASAPIEVPVPPTVAASEAVTPEAVVPSGAFPTLEMLCAAQKVMIVPQLRQAEVWLREREIATPLSPSCERAPAALARAQVSLRAPFHELAAIRIETGHATEVHLVVRTDEGWRAAPRALMVDEHDDPGCPSIVRDGRLREIRVEGASGAPALVVIDEASRGAGEEDAPDGGAPIYWSLELTRASACRLETGGARAMACDEPVVLRALRTPGQGDADPRAQVRFTTDHHLDASGHIKTSEAYDDARMWE